MSLAQFVGQHFSDLLPYVRVDEKVELGSPDKNIVEWAKAVRMPGLLGTEIAEALKQNSAGAKVILISAFADETLRHAASNLGAPLLSKPFSADGLFQVIDKATREQA